MALTVKLSDRPPAAIYSELSSLGRGCDMENLVTETVADQGLTVGDEDETGRVSALPRNPSDEIVPENPTKR